MRCYKGFKISPNEKPRSLSRTEKLNQGVFTDRELGRLARVIAQFKLQQWRQNMFFQDIKSSIKEIGKTEKLSKLAKIIGLDWKRDFVGIDLSDEDLSYDIFTHADLSGVNFSNANLSGFNFFDADLSDADLSGANLSDDNLSGANLSGANLSGGHLSDSNLRYADLRGANLRGSNFSGANLRYADLRGANLSGANFRGANLSGANLRGANLSGANLSGANLRYANLRGANLSDANLRYVTLRYADLKDTNFSGAYLEKVVLGNNYGIGKELDTEEFWQKTELIPENLWMLQQESMRTIINDSDCNNSGQKLRNQTLCRSCFVSRINPQGEKPRNQTLCRDCFVNIVLPKADKLARTNQELERRVEQRTAELTCSNQKLEQFAYIVSHDLQEPLRKIKSFSQLLSKECQDQFTGNEKAQRYLDYIIDAAERQRNLIKALLNYSRLGRNDSPKVSIDLNSVVEKVLEDLSLTIAETGATVTVSDLPTVGASATQMAQLFLNLIGNGIKFRGEAEPRIRISAQLQSSEWLISVQDNGIGLNPKYAERIFQIFQRLHSRSEYPGTGIGLAICRKIVENHDGRIWVVSEPGQGSTFYFTLPVSPSPS